MDMFVEQTHEVRHEQRSNEKPMRFTDTRMDEQVCDLQAPGRAPLGVQPPRVVAGHRRAPSP